MEVYVASLVDYVESSLGPKGLSGLKVLLNSGSGSGFYLNEVLGRCGADVSCSINLKPDGRFQKGPPNPEAKRMVTGERERELNRVLFSTVSALF